MTDIQILNLPCLKQFQSLSEFYEYIEIEQDITEAILLINIFEKLLRDTEICNSSVMEMTYISFFNRFDMNKENIYYDKYFYMKYRELLYRGFLNNLKEFSEASIHNIINKIDRIQNFAALGYFICIFFSKTLALKMFYECKRVPEKLIKLIQDNDLFELGKEMGDVWYSPLILKNNETENFFTYSTMLYNLKYNEDRQYRNLKNKLLSLYTPELELDLTSKSERDPDASKNMITPLSSQQFINESMAYYHEDPNITSFLEVTSQNATKLGNNTARNGNKLNKQINLTLNQTLYEGSLNQSTISDSSCDLDETAFFNESPLNIENKGNDLNKTLKPTDRSTSSNNNCKVPLAAKAKANQIPMAYYHVSSTLVKTLETSIQVNEEDLIKASTQIAVNLSKAKLDESFFNKSNVTASTIGPYTIGKCIGEGSFSKVFEVKRSGLDNEFALKLINFRSKAECNNVIYEIEVLKKMSDTDRSIVLYESCFNDIGAVIVMEKAEMNLKTFWKEHTKDIDHIFILHYWKLMMTCVATLHQLGFAHLDLKMQNFVIVRNSKVKLIDYGTSYKVDKNKSILDRDCPVGTVVFMSPQMMLPKCSMLHPRRADIWSMGIVLYMMVYDEQVYATNSYSDYISKITDPSFQISYPNKPGKSTKTLIGLMKCCLEYEEINRPSSPTILNYIRQLDF